MLYETQSARGGNMACFIAPTSAAILTTAFRKRFPPAWHINWLNTMIWGGAIALTVEHIAHGEIVPLSTVLDGHEQPRRHTHHAQGDGKRRHTDDPRPRHRMDRDGCHLRKIPYHRQA
jgi:hypothetical protein